MAGKLLIIVPLLQLGGQERIAAKTAELLSKDYDVTVLIFDDTDKVFDPKCRVVCINSPARSGKLGKIFAVAKRFLAVRKLRKKERFDIVYSFGPSANLINVLSRGIGRTVIGIRTYTPSESYGKIDRYTFENSDTIICCSKMIMSSIGSIEDIYKKKCVCLYNPLDTEDIEKHGAEAVDDQKFGKFTIISHGRLDPLKNWPRLIKAFSIVHKQDDNTQLLIIGEGGERERLEKLIKELGLNGAVALIGFRSNPFAYLSKADLFVLSSFVEGFPNALLEGMVFLPVISVDCLSGPGEILKERYDGEETKGVVIADHGVLVQRAGEKRSDTEIDEDDKVLAEAISKVMGDTSLQNTLKKRAHDRVMELSCEVYRERLLSILKGEL